MSNDETANDAYGYTVTYIGAGRWAVDQHGTAVGTLIQTISQGWYATDAAGMRLAVNGHRESGTNAHPHEIANTMVQWTGNTPTAVKYPEMGDK